MPSVSQSARPWSCSAWCQGRKANG
jgi:hypothetical protein